MPPATSGTNDARRVITVASVSLAAVLVLAAVGLRRLTHVETPLFTSEHVLDRALIGLAIGAALATINAILVARLPVFERVQRLAHHALEGIEPRWHTMVVVALAAAFGEEIFFRGALDPVAGKWLTGIAFVAVHGALRIRNRNGILFALFLYAASIGLSGLNGWQRLECAIAAHAAYDLTMLHWLVRGATRRSRALDRN
jgi:membrane protease YdiL (CAAX protease family)